MTKSNENGSASPQSQPVENTLTNDTNFTGATDLLQSPTDGIFRLACGDGSRMGQVIGWTTNWHDFSKSLSVPEVGKKQGTFWCAADYGSRTQRIRDNVRGVSLIVLDVEDKTKQPPPLADALALCEARGWQAFAHTTYTHKPDAPRYRLCMTPSRTIKPGELRRLVDAVAQELDLKCACDLPASGDPARLYYTPRVASEVDKATFEHGSVEGAAVDVDEMLATGKPEAVKPASAHTPAKGNGPLWDDLRAALEYIDPDPHDEWVATGHALKNAPLEPQTKNELYHKWSAKSDKYNYAECQATWESFSPTRTSYKAIFKKAQKLGWSNPASGMHEFDFSGLFGKVSSETGEIGPLLKPVSVSDVLTDPSPPPEFVWDGYIPRGVVTILGAHGGMGKSTIALMLAVCAAVGRPLFGAEVEPCKVLYVSLEDSGAIARHRLANICNIWSIDPLALLERLRIVDGTEYPELFSAESRGAGLLTETYKEMCTIVQTEGIGLVIVDNASDAYGGDEIQRRQVRAFIRALAMVIKPTNAGCLLLAHVDKNTSRTRKPEGGEGYSGSTAWHNSVRSRLFLTRADDDLLTLEHQKSNLGSMCEPINLEWAKDGLPKLVAQSGMGDLLSSIASIAQDVRSKALLLMIAEFEDRQHYCSPVTTARNNVHATLSTEPDFKKLKLNKSDCRHILHQCQRNNWLAIVDYFDSYRKPRQRWTLTDSGRAFARVSASSAPCAPSCDEDAESEQGVKAAPSAPCA